MRKGYFFAFSIYSSKSPYSMETDITGYIHIEYNKAQRLLYTSMQRSITSEELRNTLSTVSALIKKEKIQYWIADTRLLNGILISDQLWAIRKVVPVMVSSDLLKIAQVSSSDIFHYMSFENMVQQAYKLFNTSIAFEQFTTFEAAYNWLDLPN